MSTPIEKAGEFNLIRRLASISSPRTDPPVILGIGDDAAVFCSTPGMVQVVTTDAFVEGHHFDFSFYDMNHVGYKAMIVNLSDIAAMNALPIIATVALGVPGSFSIEDLEALYEGLTRAASTYGVQIVGGDMTCAPVLMLSITIIGEANEANIIYRNGANPGDRLCVSGHLGGAAMGLDILRNNVSSSVLGNEIRDDLIRRHLMPVPRLDLVNEWVKAGVRPSSLIDISDGLANELHHICAASNCGSVVEESSLPRMPDTYTGTTEPRSSTDYALNGGDDYELLFTSPPELLAQMPPDLFTEIGVMTEKDILIRRTDGSLEHLRPEGHDHFKS